MFSLTLCAAALLFTACSPRPTQTICGVPYAGCTPWQLAASIHDNGDQSFVPECIDQITATKAYIRGWLMPEESPATLICDLTPSGEVTAAVLHCETLDND